jgi:predicted alpha/beta-hydrolase family hydrolase
MEHDTMVSLARAVGSAGPGVVRFNFLYRAAGKKVPDRMPRLQECFHAVVDRVKSELSPERLLIGGQSMGGRAASMMAADGVPCHGLILLAYPLHTPGKPEKLRDAHLQGIAVPTLCLNGTRDSLCQRPIMEEVVSRLPATFTMHWLELADHGYRVPKRSGRTREDVFVEIGSAVAAWLAQLS